MDPQPPSSSGTPSFDGVPDLIPSSPPTEPVMSSVPSTPPPPSAPAMQPVPQLVGVRVETARATAVAAAWKARVVPTAPADESQPDGLVVAQEPVAGTMLPPGAVVVVDVIERTKKKRSAAPWVIGVLAVLVAALAGLAIWLNSDRNDLQSQNDALAGGAANQSQLQQQVAALTKERDQLKADNDTLKKQVDDLTKQVGDLTKQVNDLKAQNDQLTAENKALKDQQAKDAQTIADLQAKLAGVQASVVPMPNVVGQQLVAVQDFATKGKYVVKVEETTTSSTPVAAGTVLAQSPAENVPLIEGSVVWVQVFKG